MYSFELYQTKWFLLFWTIYKVHFYHTLKHTHTHKYTHKHTHTYTLKCKRNRFWEYEQTDVKYYNLKQSTKNYNWFMIAELWLGPTDESFKPFTPWGLEIKIFKKLQEEQLQWTPGIQKSKGRISPYPKTIASLSAFKKSAKFVNSFIRYRRYYIS